MRDRIEAGLLLASYLETIGFKNGIWEFKYGNRLNNINSVNLNILNIINEFLLLGGSSNIDITGWNASDDTILLIATADAVMKGDYKEHYIKALPLLKEDKRYSGAIVLESLYLLKRHESISYNKNMGGNGAAMRTGPIGIWYKDEKKIIEESLYASRLTHNYYIGYMGGVVSALFSAYALNNVKPWLWVDKLLDLYNNKIFHLYFPKDHKIEQLDDYINYWKKYKEVRLSKIKYKNTSELFKSTNIKLESLMSFNPSTYIQNYVHNNESLLDKNINWNSLGVTGIDSCIYAYDCLLNCMTTPNSNVLDFDNIIYSWDSFLINVAIHPGDSDTTACIGGLWYGLLLGYNGVDKKRMKQLEFYDELMRVVDKLSAAITTI